MSTVYLVRHGALANDCQKRFIGQIDLPLAPEGERQAEVLGEALRKRQIDVIYCSDLRRSRRTAEIIAGNCGAPIVPRLDLREIAMGEWDGLLRDEVANRFPAQYVARGDDLEHYRVSRGESFADCRERVIAAWQDIVNRGGERVVVVGHAGVNRVLLCHLLNAAITSLFSLVQHYACVNIIEVVGNDHRVCLINGQPADLASMPPELLPSSK